MPPLSYRIFSIKCVDSRCKYQCLIKYIAATITYIALYAAAIILIIRNKKPNSLNGKYWKHIYAIEKGIIVFKLIWDTS